MMNKPVLRVVFALLAVSGAVSCSKVVHNTEPLADPWLRERTPVNLRLESQIGAAIISNDMNDDAVGTVGVNLITTGLDLARVKVESLDFKFPDSEYCPTASIGPGSTLDLSNGSADFVVTAYNGETRTYTVTYTPFSDPLEGTYSFTQIAGILDAANAPKCAFVVIGGWDGAVVGSTIMDKWWHWGSGYKPTDEDDNILSFSLEKADPETGATFGTIVNTPGPNGLYANYMYNNETDMNGQYRLIPAGKGRWGKSGNGSIDIYAYEDTEYTTPLHQIEIREAGEYPINETRILTVSDLAFVRSFPGPFNNNVGDWNNDARWYIDNLRYVVWLVKKDGDTPLPNHAELLAE